MAEAGRPTTKTLRPDLDESVDFEKSSNVFITGDNLEVLKILQESYLGKIDMIYIDPPYNTGKDFVYSDKFQKTEDQLKEEMGLLDEEGRSVVGLTKNEKSSARYHSDWLNMMYPRLRLARNLLKDSGVIFISIDDNEQANLKALCDEIFGEENFVQDFLWLIGKGKKDTWTRTTQQYILCYAKNKVFLGDWRDTQLAQGNFSNPDNDPRGDWFSGSISFNEDRSNPKRDTYFTITSPSGVEWTRQWQVDSKAEMEELLRDNRIYFGPAPEYANVPRRKVFKFDENKIIPANLLDKYGTSKSAQNEIKDLFKNQMVFDTPKPSNLIKHLMYIINNKTSLILDFFAGSATTADAVMQLNAEDGGNRKYILCTLDEAVADKSAAKEAGFETIDQISRERIRRAAAKIRQEQPEKAAHLDLGFKAYRLDSSNFKNVEQKPGEITQQDLFDEVSNIKDGRGDLDILLQVMLSWGLELSDTIEKKVIEGVTVYDVAEGGLLATFSDHVPDSVIRAMAKEEPLRAIFRDSSFKTSAEKINLTEIFKDLSPNTKVKVV